MNINTQERLNDLLSRYGNNKPQLDAYSIEIESIRGEIEKELTGCEDNSYENDDWKVTQVAEGENRTISVDNLKTAIIEAELTDEQKSILQTSISSSSRQAHIFIRKK